MALLLAVLLVAWWATERAVRRARSQLAGPTAGGVREATGSGNGVLASGGSSVRTAPAPVVTVRAEAPAALRIAALVLAGLTVVVSVLSGALIYVTGERGARAVWQGVAAQPVSGSGDVG